ncbi:LysR family transcriptional regulator [Paenibacillus sp. 7124]|uniref:LysR family transcriptional regulator n=1 Tax=Paenibacillus apii TaxID=1850370 RepID=A0A6M1PSE5_9BACL|nr:LysR family transcriptional regulator [Paenibacillus apii]NGM84952.1 LysR family transcriptional regulator [Paenibacillus apii]NJJ41697.1 LysR family transcriptional regulator [Paenibacillus apii]
MNLRHLQYFQVIAEMEHITQAAVKLSITQPSLSHAISELEKELGTSLFEKQGRNIRLTKYGRLFLGYVNRALDELEKGEKRLRELTSPSAGVVDLAFIGTLGTHFIPALVQSFSVMEEHRQISFTFHQGSTRKMIQGLKDDLYDIAFCAYAERDPELEFVPLAEQELVVITPSNHPLTGSGSVELKEIAAYPLVYFAESNELRPILDGLFAKAGARPNIVCELEEDSAMAGLVSVGYGIAVMPRFSALAHYDVDVLSVAYPAYDRFIYAVSVRSRYLSPAASEFRNFAIRYGREFFAAHKPV